MDKVANRSFGFADLGESPPIVRMHAEAFERPNLSDITIPEEAGERKRK